MCEQGEQAAHLLAQRPSKQQHLIYSRFICLLLINRKYIMDLNVIINLYSFEVDTKIVAKCFA